VSVSLKCVSVYTFLVFDTDDQVHIKYFPDQNKCLILKIVSVRGGRHNCKPHRLMAVMHCWFMWCWY